MEAEGSNPFTPIVGKPFDIGRRAFSLPEVSRLLLSVLELLAAALFELLEQRLALFVAELDRGLRGGGLPDRGPVLHVSAVGAGAGVGDRLALQNGGHGVVDQADVASCSFVGSKSVVGKGARIESGAMLCAASTLKPGTVIPSGEIWSGNPAMKLGTLTDTEKGYIIKAAKHMVLLSRVDQWDRY